VLVDIFFQSIKGQMTYHPPLKKIEKNKAQTLRPFFEGLGTLGFFIPRDWMFFIFYFYFYPLQLHFFSCFF